MKEESHIREALKKCGYPDWIGKMVKDQIKNNSKKDKPKKKDDGKKSAGILVVLPYIQGVSESLQ